MIKAKFERIKGLTKSDLLMDSDASDHNIHLMMMMEDSNKPEGGGGEDRKHYSY